jgi:hypothetical protein
MEKFTLPQETRDDILQDIAECYADEDDEQFVLYYCQLYFEYELDPDEVADECGLYRDYDMSEYYDKQCSECGEKSMCGVLGKNENDGPTMFICHECSPLCWKCEFDADFPCKGCI